MTGKRLPQVGAQNTKQVSGHKLVVIIRHVSLWLQVKKVKKRHK